MSFTYKSGEEIRPGDRIRLDGHPGKVEFVVAEPTGDPATDWYLEEFGGGVMLIDDEMGNIFVGRESLEEENVGGLELVSRAPEGEAGIEGEPRR
jgi:hypothetical protein